MSNTGPGELHYRNGVCHQAELESIGKEEDGVVRATFTPRGSVTAIKRDVDFRQPPVADDTCHFAGQCSAIAT